MKIIGTEILLKTQFIDMKATEYEDQKGETKYWVWAQRPNARKAVVIAAVVDNGFLPGPAPYKTDLRLVVTKEMRIPLGDYEWGFPAGLIDKNEDPIKAATRELKEETGLTIKKVIRYSPFIYNTAGMTDESISMVYVECDGELNKDGLEDSEDIETFLMTQEEVAELLKDETKKFGAKAWMIMDNFARNNTI